MFFVESSFASKGTLAMSENIFEGEVLLEFLWEKTEMLLSILHSLSQQTYLAYNFSGAEVEKPWISLFKPCFMFQIQFILNRLSQKVSWMMLFTELVTMLIFKLVTKLSIWFKGNFSYNPGFLWQCRVKRSYHIHIFMWQRTIVINKTTSINSTATTHSQTPTCINT